MSVANGNLTITTYTQNGTHYTGWLDGTNGLRGTYGYLEARINFNDAAGM